MKNIKEITLTAIVTGALITFPFINRTPYILGVAETILTYYIYAMAVNLLTGYTGIRSFGQAAFLGVGGYVTGLVIGLHQLGIVGLLASMLVGALLGLAIGALSLRLQSVYFFMTTLGVAEMLRIVAQNWTSVTAGPRGLIVRRTLICPGLGAFPHQLQLYFVSALASIIVFWAIRSLMRSHTGKILMSIRDSQTLASSVGINPTHYKAFAFTVAGMITAFSGGLHAMNYGIVIPDWLSLQYTTIGLLMILIGGKGELWGPFVGSLVYVGFNEGLRSLGNFRLVFFALVLIVVVLVFPNGLIGTLRRRICASYRDS